MSSFLDLTLVRGIEDGAEILFLSISADEEGFQAEFLKHGIHSLPYFMLWII